MICDKVTVCNLGQARYVEELAFSDRFQLSRDFVASACALSKSYNTEEYMNFLDTWGTVREFEFCSYFTKVSITFTHGSF